MPKIAEACVVIGDAHAQVAFALRTLAQIEEEQGRRIAQVFSVGDLGLFLREEDCSFFSGPSRAAPHFKPLRTLAPGELRVGTYFVNPPLEYIAQGARVGFEVKSLMEEIARRLGLKPIPRQHALRDYPQGDAEWPL